MNSLAWHILSSGHCYQLTGSGVSHGEDTGASVPQVEVLVLELLAVDALTTGALGCVSQ